MQFDMLSPERLLDGSMVLGMNVKERELSFSTESVPF